MSPTVYNDGEYKLYLDHTAPLGKRVADLIARMSLEEKVSWMLHNAPAIPRLNLPQYNWWSESLHGVARAGIATVFPQVIGMAATFDDPLIYDVATTISDEARAKHHEFARHGDRGLCRGLNECAPNINIFRDPRWGRGQETFGEDPYLTARLGVAYVKGLQGEDEKYLKTAAIVKHFAAHSGPEKMRHRMDVTVSAKDLRETYLYAFKECVKAGKVAGVMGAYNRVNGEPCCASKTLLQDILRDEWGFEGYTVADYGAIDDIHSGHQLTRNDIESSVWALSCGCNLDCGWSYGSLVNAVKEGRVAEEKIDAALQRTFSVFFRLGFFDPADQSPYAQIPYEVNDCDRHRDLALETARQSMVLLKNEGHLLPLSQKLNTIAVIGPNAAAKQILLGNYCGTPSKYVTLLDGIRNKVGPNTNVIYAEGCDHATKVDTDCEGRADKGFAEARAAAERADVVILCMGLSPDIEGEESNANQYLARLKGIDPALMEKVLPPDAVKLINSLSTDGGDDKVSLELPGVQNELIRQISALGKPIVLVLANGSPVAVNWAQENIPAIVEVWYPGEEGGNALADVLFGEISPAGRLPVTFVKSCEQLPPFESYAMKGRTYRYMKEEPLYPFGYGLSYTDFQYSNLKISANQINAGDSLTIQVDVANCGTMAGDEVIQVYLKETDAPPEQRPEYELKEFTRIKLLPGEKTKVEFLLTPRQMALIDEQGRCMLEPGHFKVFVGGQQPDRRSRELTGKDVLAVDFAVVGAGMEMAY